jgi:hypothetical protein
MSTIPTPDTIEAELDHLLLVTLYEVGPDGKDYATGAARALKDRMTPGQVESSRMDAKFFAGAMHAAWWRVGLRPDAPREGL